MIKQKHQNGTRQTEGKGGQEKKQETDIDTETPCLCAQVSHINTRPEAICMYIAGTYKEKKKEKVKRKKERKSPKLTL